MSRVRVPSPALGRAVAGAVAGAGKVAGADADVAGADAGEVQLLVQVAHIAQSVEHILGKDEVTGSIPVVSSGQW